MHGKLEPLDLKELFGKVQDHLRTYDVQIRVEVNDWVVYLTYENKGYTVTSFNRPLLSLALWAAHQRLIETDAEQGKFTPAHGRAY